MRSRTLLFVVLAVLALVPGWTGKVRLPLFGSDAKVTSTRVPLDPADPARRRVGRLTYLGGIALDSPDPAFGGFSAMQVRGDRVTLLSDGGNVVRFRLNGAGRVSGPRFAELPRGPGTGWRKMDRDSEAMAVDPATGTVWVAFERANAIWRYPAGFGEATGSVRPAAMAEWRENGGPEAMVRRRDGSFIVIQEEARGDTRAAPVWTRDPIAGPPAFTFRYRPPPGFDPADATELPDGRLLVLNRWWGLPLRFASSLVVIDPRAIRPGAVVAGQEVARLESPLIAGNFEAVTATVERGRTVIWLATDNDLMAFRPSLLLKFRLD